MTTTPKPPAVFSCRASSAKQEDSVKAQLERDLPWFSEQYEIVEVYDEGTVSASKDRSKRTRFLEMIADLTTGKYANGYNGQRITICCQDASRFTREGINQCGDIKTKLAVSQVKLHGKADGVVDYNNDNDEIKDAVNTWSNAKLPRTIAEKGVAGRVRAVEAGKTDGKPIPYAGAKRFVTDRGQEIIVLHGEKGKRMKDWQSSWVKGKPCQVEAMEYLFSMAMTADHSYRAMARIMTERTGENWTHDNVADRLHNPFYAGGSRIGVKPKGKHFRLEGGTAVKTALHKATDALVVWDTHEAIVPRETFEAVQAKYPVGKAEGNGKKQYALSSLVKCGACGGTMSGFADQHGRVRFQCQSYKDTHGKKCGCWTIREEELLGELLPRLVSHLDGKALAAMEVKEPMDIAPQAGERLKEEAEKLSKDIADRLARLHMIDLDFLPAYQNGIKEARTRLAAIEQEIADMQPADDSEWAAKMAKFWAETKTVLVETYRFHYVSPKTGKTTSFGHGYEVEPSTLRSALKSLKTQITLFFDRNEKDTGWTRTRTIVEGELGLGCEGLSVHERTLRLLRLRR